MVVSALRALCLAAVLLLTLQVSAGQACFGPKLFIGVAPGVEGEMRYHLVAIYLHEKTGIDSSRIELKPGQSGLDAIAAQEVDLGFAASATAAGKRVLRLDEGLGLYSGERPLHDLQFSTAGRAFARLQKVIDRDGLAPVRQAILAGTLPAVAVRNFMLEQGWI